MNICHKKCIKLISYFFLISNLLGCSISIDEPQSKTVEENVENSTKVDSLDINLTIKEIKPDTLEQKLIDAGLIDVQSLDPFILVDLKYSTTDNFMNKNVYGNLKKAYLQEEVALDLLKCQQKLKEKDSTLTLLIYDAVRPRSVQQIMWDVLDMPVSEKTKFVSNPKNGSIHNYGSAVDLTIARIDGTPLDMGADYDDIRRIAYPSLESEFLQKGELTQEQINNRKLLREVMKAGGFSGISTEWWHFNRFSRDVAKSKYQILE